LRYISASQFYKLSNYFKNTTKIHLFSNILESKNNGTIMDTTLLNVGKICDMLMLEEESVKNLLKKFAIMLPEILNEIRAAADSNDVLLLSRLGHKLKGTAGNFRIDEMENISSEINKVKECDENTMSLIAKLQLCTDRLIVEINKL